MALKTTRGDKGTPLKGRGAPSNIEGRFERWEREAADDGWPSEAHPQDSDEPPPFETHVSFEQVKSIISRNDSPDLSFEQSINPYRGCEHGCIYCLDGQTSILMADGSTKPLGDLLVGDEIYGTEKRGHYRYYAKTRVLAHWRTRKPAYRVQLADGSSLVASADHRFLTERGWKFVARGDSSVQRPQLTLNNSLLGFGTISRTSDAATASEYLCGQAVKSRADLSVAAIEELGTPQDLFDITTGTGDFIANGVISHNCYARPSHGYLGLSPGLDFETRIFAKKNAAEVLRDELSARNYRCKLIAIGANTDAYQPVERELRITRSILEVLSECEHPAALITKNSLIERDIDLLAPMAEKNLVRAFVSVTNLDPVLARKLEPRAAAPYRRIETIKRLAEAGIPVGVMVAPVIPFMTDRDLEQILERARDAGATAASYVLLRLPYEVAPLFKDWLATHYPLKQVHVISLVRQMSGGKDYDSSFGTRQRGTGTFATLLEQRFRIACERLGLNRHRGPVLDTTRFKPPGSDLQPSLF